MNEQDVTNYFVTPDLCGGQEQAGTASQGRGALPWVPPTSPAQTNSAAEGAERPQDNLQHHSHQYINSPLSLAWEFQFIPSSACPRHTGVWEGCFPPPPLSVLNPHPLQSARLGRALLPAQRACAFFPSDFSGMPPLSETEGWNRRHSAPGFACCGFWSLSGCQQEQSVLTLESWVTALLCSQQPHWQLSWWWKVLKKQTQTKQKPAAALWIYFSNISRLILGRNSCCLGLKVPLARGLLGTLCTMDIPKVPLKSWRDQAAHDPCHANIPLLSPLEPQRAESLLIPWPSTGTGHCLTSAVREFRHSWCWSSGGSIPKSTKHTGAAVPALSTPSTSTVQDPVLPKPWRRQQGFFTCSLGCLQRPAHSRKKNRSRASSQPAKKAPSGAPGTARSCHQAQAAQLQLLALWQNRSWGTFGMCQRSWCRSRDGGDRGAHLTTWHPNSRVWLCDFVFWDHTGFHSPLSPPAYAAHNTRSPRATSSFPNPSADSHSCYLKIKLK